MKRALFAIASVAIVATAVGVEAANAQYSPAPPAYTPPPARGYPYAGTGQYPPVPVSPYPSTPTYTRGGPGYGYGPGPYFVCQAVGARSVGYGRAYFVADAKWQALIRCERYSGICIISYCVPAS
jgi:hypothetical protein